MRKSIYLIIAVIVLGCTACNNNTYSNLRTQEDRLIENYISRNRIVLLETLPADTYQWKENEYYKVSITNYGVFYFHLIERGDSIRVDSVSPTKNDTVDLQIVSNDLIVTRYKRFDLTENPDTASYWTTQEQAYPYEFHYNNYTDCEAASWHAAVRLMRYPDSQCQIIVPSKAGFTAEQQSVTPYCYILKIKVRQ